ncbi:RNA polymerase sigma factor SigJ [Baekduia sp. Peel2402]|uniref:RNA polymerase sigma factor SigJ n=1 Tax=Baekduia sp. Peel2402 TaxID=3458296 RepID=UPI00403EE9CE
MTLDTDTIAALRPLVFSIAYRMTGSVAEAEDIAQETLLRTVRERDAGTEIEYPKAYMTAIATRLSIDHLRSARARREEYVGAWLPEPLLTDGPADPVVDVAAEAEMADEISQAFLVVLERLTPVERAVFLLREAFDYKFAEIGEIVGRNADHCRQIAARARRHVVVARPRFESSREARAELADKFLDAARAGDMEALVAMLADDAVLTGDGGGKAAALPKPLVGAERIAHALRAFFRQGEKMGAIAERVELGGQPGWLARAADGTILAAMTLQVADGHVAGISSVVNPDKLTHLQPGHS